MIREGERSSRRDPIAENISYLAHHLRGALAERLRDAEEQLHLEIVEEDPRCEQQRGAGGNARAQARAHVVTLRPLLFDERREAIGHPGVEIANVLAAELDHVHEEEGLIVAVLA